MNVDKVFNLFKGVFDDDFSVHVPIIVRKGRNTLSALCGTNQETKKFMQGVVDAYGAKMAEASIDRAVLLGWQSCIHGLRELRP